MKVLIADKFPETYIDQLKQNNVDVIYNPMLGEKDLPEAAKEVDCIVVRSTVVNSETIEKSEKLKLIIRAGAGVNNIDIQAANRRSVAVSNCPGKNAIAVAELTIGLMISLDRRIPHNVLDFKKGIWNKAEYSNAQGLFGKTLAIIGFGNIGKEVAKRALAFGMNVYAKDIIKINYDGVKEFTNYEDVFPFADIISVHLPASAETKNLFNEKLFALMKNGAIFINTSRADVVDEEALIKAIKEKNLRVGLDVFKGEPEEKSGNVSSKLQDFENVYVTHHIGASTEQAQNAVAEETVKIILNFIQNSKVLNCVNVK